MKIFVTSHAEVRWKQRAGGSSLLNVLFDVFVNKNATEIIEKNSVHRVESVHKLWHSASKTILLFADTMETLMSVNCVNRKYLKPRRTQVWLRKITQKDNEK